MEQSAGEVAMNRMNRVTGPMVLAIGILVLASGMLALLTLTGLSTLLTAW